MNYLKVQYNHLHLPEKSLAEYIRVKQVYRNGIIYHYNPNKESLKLGLTPNRVRRLFKDWLEWGLVKREGIHIRFASNNRKACGKVKATDILGGIRELKIVQALKRQQFVVEVKRNLIKPDNLKAYKWAIKNAFKLKFPAVSVKEELLLTCDKAAELLGVSRSTAHRVLLSGARKGWYTRVSPYLLTRTERGEYRRVPSVYSLSPAQ